jgi:hypothetical protein
MPENGPATVTSRLEAGNRFSSAEMLVIMDSRAFLDFRDDKINPHSPADCNVFREKAQDRLEEDARDQKKVNATEDPEIKLQQGDDPLKPVYATFKVMGMMRKSSLALMGKIDANSPLGLIDLRQIMGYYNTIKALSEGTVGITPCPDAEKSTKFLSKLEEIAKDPLVRTILQQDKLNGQGR